MVAKQSTKNKVNHYEQAHYNQTQPTMTIEETIELLNKAGYKAADLLK